MYFGFVPWRIVILFLLIEIRGFKMFAEILDAKPFLLEKKFLFQRQVSIFWSSTKLSVFGIFLSHVEQCFRQCQNSRWLLPAAAAWTTDAASLKPVGSCKEPCGRKALAFREEERPWTNSTNIYVTVQVRREHVQRRRFCKVNWKVFRLVNNYPKEGRKSTLSPGLAHPTPLPPGMLWKCPWYLKTWDDEF